MCSNWLDCYILELINSKINEIVVQKNQYISDKEDKSAHGIGISSIRDIVEKYEGTLDISYDDTSFKVVILIGGWDRLLGETYYFPYFAT